MIVVGGGGGAFLLVTLLVMAAFVLVPLLLFRSAARSVVLAGPAWEPVPPSGWDVPDAPVLPAVSAADVVSLRDRLGHDVRVLDPGGDPVARQAMADAAERLSTCVTLLERSSSQAQLRTAWLAAVEGLHATRLVRGRLGLDLGPEPPLPPTGPRLTGDARLDVDGRAYAGGPSYAPGRPHWFPGGSHGGRWVPGGWYDAPFWPAGLVLGGLGGLALGGLAGAVFADDLDGGWDGGLDGGFDGGFDGGGYDDGVFGGGGFGGGGWGDDARFDGFGDGGFGGGGWGGGDGGGFGGGDSGGGDW